MFRFHFPPQRTAASLESRISGIPASETRIRVHVTHAAASSSLSLLSLQLRVTSQAQTTSSRFARRLVPVCARFLLFGATRVPAYRRYSLPLPFRLSHFTNRVLPRLLRLSFSLLSTSPPIPDTYRKRRRITIDLASENQIFIRLDDFGSNRSVTQRNATVRFETALRFVSFRSPFRISLLFRLFFNPFSFSFFSFLPSFVHFLPPSFPLTVPVPRNFLHSPTTMPPVNSLFLRRSTIEII